MKTYYKKYKNITDYITDVKKGVAIHRGLQPKPKCNNIVLKKYVVDGGDCEDWFRSKDFENAFDVFTKGYTAAIEKLKSSTTNTNSVFGQELKRKNVISVAGAPVVPLAIQGRPLCMMRRKTEVVNFVKSVIYVSISVDYSVKASEIIEASAKMLDFVNSLKNKMAVEIHIVNAFRDAKNTERHVVDYIAYNSQVGKISAGALSFLLCHPSSLRRFELARMATIEESATIKHYGIPLDEKETTEAIKENCNNKCASSYFVSIADVVKQGSKYNFNNHIIK